MQIQSVNVKLINSAPIIVDIEASGFGPQSYPLEMILSEQQMDLWHDTKNSLILGMDGQRHRASADAELIQQTYMATRYQQENQHNSEQGISLQ